MSKFEHVFIAEKPSLAEAIAQARAEQVGGRASKNDGYWSVGNDAVTWLFGHMYELAEPGDYSDRWKSGGIESLPIEIAEGEWKMFPNEDKKAHIRKIVAVMKDGTNIVNCGDAAREGQLLVDEVIVENGIDPFASNVKRLWVKSMARKDMLKALEDIFPNADKQPLYNSATCRQRADWLHGMNFSRLYSALARSSGHNVGISVGRVQTPTLRLVVDRDRERKNFKAVDHFLPKIEFEHEKGRFSATWVIPAEYEGLDPEGRLIDKTVAEKIVAKIAGKKGSIASFKSTKKFQAPILPYSLSILQAACGSQLGMTAQEVLDTAQSLYETHKATTYPRSDSRYLPTAILSDEAPGIMEALGETDVLGEAVSGGDLKLKSAAWDDSKISDHHGIIPTSEFSAGMLKRMSDIERKVFFIIAKAFVAQFYPPYTYNSLVAEVSCEREKFKATGKEVLDYGWKKVYGAEETGDDEDEDETGQTLPVMEKGDDVEALKGELNPKRTTPPPAFTDGTLITAMANVHRFVTNPETKKRLKENEGLGTEATRAATIEKLLRKKFLRRKGKNGLESSEFGQSVIDVLPEDLKDPGLTALWESALDKVAKGNLEPEKFMTQLGKTISAGIEGARGSSIEIKGVRAVRPIDGHGETCPKCGEGKLITREVQKGQHKGKKFLSCTRYPDCDHSQWPQEKVDPIDGHGEACEKCGTGKMLTRLVKKDGPNKGKKFLGCDNQECKNARWPAENIDLIDGHGKDCPECGNGKMVTKKVWSKKKEKHFVLLGCDNYPDCTHSEFPEPKVDPLPGHGKDCPECGEGKLMTKEITSKKPGPNQGKRFKLLSCNNYPECKHSEWPENANGGTRSGGGRSSGGRGRRAPASGSTSSGSSGNGRISGRRGGFAARG